MRKKLTKELTPQELIRNRIKLLVRDIEFSDEEYDELFRIVLTELAVETKIFRKLYGFTVDENIVDYNFSALAEMNEEVEQEPTNITIGRVSPEDFEKFIETGVFPEVPIEKEFIDDPYRSHLIDVVDILDDEGYSISHKFEYRGGSYYYLTDSAYRRQADGKPFVFVATVIPDIGELPPMVLQTIFHSLVAGIKFYAYDTQQSTADTQSSNYNFLRWHQAKEELRNRFANYVRTKQRSNKWQL